MNILITVIGLEKKWFKQIDFGESSAQTFLCIGRDNRTLIRNTIHTITLCLTPT